MMNIHSERVSLCDRYPPLYESVIVCDSSGRLTELKQWTGVNWIDVNENEKGLNIAPFYWIDFRFDEF